MSLVRCFVAIELSDEVRARLSALQESLRAEVRGVRWTRADQVHLTIKFLGEVADADLPAVCSATNRVSAGYAPFEVDVRGTGCFPPRGPARIIWVGIPTPHPTLIDCRQACEEAYAELGFPAEERVYHPHLTIGRVSDHAAAAKVRDVLERHEPFAAGAFTARELVLFQSVLAPSGPTYTVLARYRLTAPA